MSSRSTGSAPGRAGAPGRAVGLGAVAPGGVARGAGGFGAGALLLVSEGAWLSLAFDVIANGSAGPGRPRVDMPYLAFVLPALAALGVVTLARGRARRCQGAGRWAWRAAAALGALAGAALSAGLVTGLSAPAATWAAAFHPWAIPTRSVVAARAVPWSWAVVLCEWGRGAWVAAARPTVRRPAVSLLVGALVFLLVFGHQAATGAGSFDRASSAAPWLLFVYFPVGLAAAAWAQRADVERQVLRRVRGASSALWLPALAVPLALVVLVALLLGGAGAAVGPAAGHVLHAVGAVLGSIGDWLFSRLPRIALHPEARAKPITFAQTAPRRHRLGTATESLSPLGIAVLCVLGAVLTAGVALGVRAVLRWSRRRRPVATAGDERESVFTWGHVGEQARRLLCELLRRIAGLFEGRRTAAAASGEEAVGPDPLPGDPVRVAYRRLLLAARAADEGRGSAETPRELAARLRAFPGVARGGTVALDSLTSAYEDVRYAGAPPWPFADQAAADADVLAAALGTTPPEPTRPETGAGGRSQ